MDHLREAAHVKPDNVLINVHRYGVNVRMSDQRGIQQKTISWIEVDASIINPITLAIEGMKETTNE